MYDLIGDIHGYATELKALLTKLGYKELNGVWQHPERQVIFLGDFVDRGPEQVETVAIARAMVEKGTARAVMGNHEFNAVAWASEDPKEPRAHLREHTAKNRNQHDAFLRQVGEGSKDHDDMIAWFKTLPVYLDLPELRVVHACWHPEYIDLIGQFTNQENQLLAAAWEASSREGSDAFNAVETLLKGLEIPLPDGHHFYDKERNKRTNIRTSWWMQGQLTYRDLAMVPGQEIHRIPDKTIKSNVLPGYDGEKPVFIGHYWMNGTPKPLSEHIACLDYSVAGEQGGKLCAYRFNGETTLSADSFVWVEGRGS